MVVCCTRSVVIDIVMIIKQTLLLLLYKNNIVDYWTQHALHNGIWTLLTECGIVSGPHSRRGWTWSSAIIGMYLDSVCLSEPTFLPPSRKLHNPV